MRTTEYIDNIKPLVTVKKSNPILGTDRVTIYFSFNKSASKLLYNDKIIIDFKNMSLIHPDLEDKKSLKISTSEYGRKYIKIRKNLEDIGDIDTNCYELIQEGNNIYNLESYNNN
jgi:hypothetical protein